MQRPHLRAVKAIQWEKTTIAINTAGVSPMTTTPTVKTVSLSNRPSIHRRDAKRKPAFREVSARVGAVKAPNSMPSMAVVGCFGMILPWPACIDGKSTTRGWAVLSEQTAGDCETIG